jgi:hypothetical protein
MKLSGILKVASIIVGVIVTVMLLNTAPVLIIIDGLAAAVYFAGESLKKKGK